MSHCNNIKIKLEEINLKVEEICRDCTPELLWNKYQRTMECFAKIVNGCQLAYIYIYTYIYIIDIYQIYIHVMYNRCKFIVDLYWIIKNVKYLL